MKGRFMQHESRHDLKKDIYLQCPRHSLEAMFFVLPEDLDRNGAFRSPIVDTLQLILVVGNIPSRMLRSQRYGE